MSILDHIGNFRDPWDQNRYKWDPLEINGTILKDF